MAVLTLLRLLLLCAKVLFVVVVIASIHRQNRVRSHWTGSNKTLNEKLHALRQASTPLAYRFFLILLCPGVGDGGGDRACEGVAQVRGDHFEGERSVLHLLVGHQRLL